MLRNRLRWAEVLIPLLAFGVRLIPGPRTIDDAYITFRYARNLLDGHGLVYNPGQAVLGTTTPLFTLLLSALGIPLGGSDASFPLIALIVSAAADAATTLLLIRLGSRLGSSGAGVATALIWAVHPWSVTFAIGGMETSLFIALLSATFYLHLAGRPIMAAGAGGLALLTRPDALIFLAPILVDWALVRLRRQGSSRGVAWREAAAFGAPVGSWIVFSSLSYGSPIPQSLFAKAVAYQLPASAGLVRLLQHYATPLMWHEILGSTWIAVGLILYPTLFVLGVLLAVRTTARAWPLFVYPWFYLLAYSIANPLLFRWYLVPPMPLYLLGIYLGVARFSRDLKHWLPLALFTLLGLVGTLSAWTARPDHGPTRPAPKMAFIELELLYERAAQSLSDRLQAGGVLAAADIGTLGYFAPGEILDLLGLISPESTDYYPLPTSAYAINYAVPSDLVADLRPEFIVILEVYGRNTLLQDQRFRRDYELLEELDTNIYGSDGLLIFSRLGPG
ncbi:MAG: hypothetical protein IH858_04435 [Chloroflexi bacterium]|nr:hypothetical protein [Chloroflexota bacterium]